MLIKILKKIFDFIDHQSNHTTNFMISDFLRTTVAGCNYSKPYFYPGNSLL